MKRTLSGLMIVMCTLYGFSQQLNCGCDTANIIPENQYKCDTIWFSNGAKLFWQWNCDSSWLTFEYTKPVIIKSCNEMNVYGCNRTGLNFLKEYPGYLLFQYKWISGCCTPPDIVFMSKETGEELKRIPNNLFVWADADDNYVLYFSDTTDTRLKYLDNSTDKEYSLQFERGQVKKSAAKNWVMQFGDLFKDFRKNNDDFTFEFKTIEGTIKKMKIKFE